ncbi:hypothetical protein DFH09DRAFT_1094411 [Mycena vulgaris]|nr:hypothetical protein DFH09DRAFT_1094411 [Mycena vulgaris]
MTCTPTGITISLCAPRRQRASRSPAGMSSRPPVFVYARGFSLRYKVHSAPAHALIPSTFRRRHPALRSSSAAPHPVQPSYIVSTIAYSAPPCSSLLHPMLAAPRPFLPLTRTIRFAPHAGYAPFDDHAIAVWTVTCTAPLVAIFTAQTTLPISAQPFAIPAPLRASQNHPALASDAPRFIIFSSPSRRLAPSPCPPVFTRPHRSLMKDQVPEQEMPGVEPATWDVLQTDHVESLDGSLIGLSAPRKAHHLHLRYWSSRKLQHSPQTSRHHEDPFIIGTTHDVRLSTKSSVFPDFAFGRKIKGSSPQIFHYLRMRPVAVHHSFGVLTLRNPDVLPRGHEIAAGVPESALGSCTLPGPVELLGNNWREIDDVSLTIYHMNGSEERIESLAPVHRNLDGVNLRLEQYNVNIAFERGLSLFNHRLPGPKVVWVVVDKRTYRRGSIQPAHHQRHEYPTGRRCPRDNTRVSRWVVRCAMENGGGERQVLVGFLGTGARAHVCMRRRAVKSVGQLELESPGWGASERDAPHGIRIAITCVRKAQAPRSVISPGAEKGKAIHIAHREGEARSAAEECSSRQAKPVSAVGSQGDESARTGTLQSLKAGSATQRLVNVHTVVCGAVLWNVQGKQKRAPVDMGRDWTAGWRQRRERGNGTLSVGRSSQRMGLEERRRGPRRRGSRRDGERGDGNDGAVIRRQRPRYTNGEAGSRPDTSAPGRERAGSDVARQRSDVSGGAQPRYAAAELPAYMQGKLGARLIQAERAGQSP